MPESKMDFAVGQRVVLAENASLSEAVKTLHSSDGATVLRRSDRCSDREGGTRYLIQFDTMDALYGMYWLTAQQLSPCQDSEALATG
jgi:hypothetical protein